MCLQGCVSLPESTKGAAIDNSGRWFGDNTPVLTEAKHRNEDLEPLLDHENLCDEEVTILVLNK